MSERRSRKVLRRAIAAKLSEFYRLLVGEVSQGADDLLRRVELWAMRCPACGTQMDLSKTIATADPQEPEHVFACRKCGVSYFTKDYIPVGGASV